jgi:phage terminase large subunit GpA-like protein
MKTIEEYRQFVWGLLEPPKKESVVDWCENNVSVPTGAVQGQLSMRMAPYGREILERFGDRKTRSLTMCFASQSSKTTLIILGMLYRLCKNPQDAMWVMPNRELANSFSKSRWMKFIQECPPTKSLLPLTGRGEIDRHLFAFMEQHFINMFLKFVGSNSPANLASFPCGTLVMDETDKYGEQTKYEAAALDLAEERTKTFPFSLIVKASTPTMAARMIWPAFEASDQRRYWVPCPRCGKDILLFFKFKSEVHGDCGLRWYRGSDVEVKTNGEWDLNKVKQQAYYKCQECGGEIQDYERSKILEAGKWIPGNTQTEEGVYGYHLSSLYSILSDKTSFGAIAVKWLQSKSILSGRQNFINSWLAETWDAERAFDHIDIQREEYNPLSLPEKATALMFADVQENGFWVVIRRFMPPSKELPYGESWLLHADFAESEDHLEKLAKDFNVLNHNVLLDMAHRPNQVGRMCIEHNWRGLWGTDTKAFYHRQPNNVRIERIYSVVQLRDPHLGTPMANRTFQRAKYIKYSKSAALDLVSSLRYATPTIWHVSANVSDRYQRQLNSKVKVMQQSKKTGRWESFWKDLHTEDHLLDAECGVAIQAVILGLVAVPQERIDIAA